AVPGLNIPGERFFEDARQRGAVLLVGSRREDLAPHPAWVLVRDARRAMGILAHNACGRPSERARLVGITGTNGKTSTTWILEALAQAAGASPGVLGTVNYRYAGRELPAAHTTPEAPVLQEILRDMVEAGCDTAILEVSSHAIAMERVRGCRWAVAAATNLSPEHLDFHGNMAEYGETKARLFTELLPSSPGARAAVLNMDDPWAASLAARTSVPVITVSAEGRAAAVRTREARVDAGGIDALLDSPVGPLCVHSALGGRHNLANIALSVGVACAMGWPAAAMEEGIAACRRIPGRMEPVANTAGLRVWVDYAHTPDALDNALRTARSMTDGALWVVFGAGGDRDRSKRPLMGAAVARAAEHPVITSDNPRSELAAAVMEDILAGVPADERRRVQLVEDRREAIHRVIASARPGDGVLIAGKGHETYVEVNRVRTHFDDREVAAEALRHREGGAHA
ncbi:MAG: UDP-N-acetylmuramoyl-L-alanyl-D-glutamate--2,6-diaminopimelate ligase, partial [Deltaproteobacteria bacterium]|nr:UDP-N-acetylmuramoyl-L-alanyl-D-glutamate--2,6-diaminopimelate ligase [Deltaproteobacteria bacterium]